jgi:uncharacterized membrane protein
MRKTNRRRSIAASIGSTMSEPTIGPARLEAFCDGVVAILVTIMVLELKIPHSGEPAALWALWPVFLSYVLSFLVIAIYWVNHHRLFHDCRHVGNAVLWSTIVWLFCISLIPFATAYMDENRFAAFPTAVYAATLLLAGLSFVPMRRAVARQHKGEATFDATSRRAARKNYVSLTLYAVSIPLAFVHPAITLALAFAVAGMYFLPNAWLGEAGHR